MINKFRDYQNDNELVHLLQNIHKIFSRSYLKNPKWQTPVKGGSIRLNYIKVESTTKGMNTRYIVTNIEDTAKEVYYVGNTL